MSYSFNYSDITPTNISIIVNKEAQMPDPKGGNPISYKTGELQYLINGSKHKLIMKGPLCESKSGLFLQKEEEPQQMAQQAYHQPTIGGYPNQQMFNPSAMGGQKKPAFKKKVNASVPFQLQPNSNQEHEVFINQLNEITKIVNEELFKVKHSIYAHQAIQGQQIINRPLVSYRVDDITHQIDMESDPTVWFQVKKYEEQMNKVFMLPDKTYACYKDLMNLTFTGIPIFSFSCFFNQLNKTCKLNLEGFIIKDIKTSIVANDMYSIADEFANEDADIGTRVSESYKKIIESKNTSGSTSCTSEQQSTEPPVDLPVIIPPQTTVLPPQTYQQPQTPMQSGILPQSYQMPQTYQMPQQLPPQNYLR